MVVYSFYVFDRHTECIFYKHWQQREARRLEPPGPPAAAPAAQRSAASARSDDAKLVFGAVFSLRNMVRKLGGSDDALIGFATAQYRLHYFETASNLRFVLLTDPAAPSMRSVLQQIYVSLWVEHVVKNPLAPVEHQGGVGVRSELFEQVLDRILGAVA